MKQHPLHRILAVVAVGALALTAAACTNSESGGATTAGSSQTTAAPDSDTSSSSDDGAASDESQLGAERHVEAEAVQEDAAVAALVPQKIKDAGVLTLVTDPTYAPIDFTNSDGDIIGLEPDIALAVANKMGLRMENSRADFNGILAGLASHRWDASFAAFSITPERTEVVDMVSYMSGATAVMTTHDNPNNIDSEDSLCGLTVSVQTGTTQALSAIPQFEQNCKDKGLAPMTPLVVPQQDSANQALVSGRAQAMVADQSLVAYYTLLQPDVYTTAPGISIDPSLVGVAMAKDDGTLAQAFQAAFQSLIDDGDMLKILSAWHLESAAVPTAEINPNVDAGE